MKFRCEREALVEALSTAGRAANPRGTSPALSGVRMQLRGDELQLTGTDLEITIELSTEVGGEKDGKVLVSARLFNDIVRSLGSGRVEVETAEEQLRISNGRSHFTMRLMSVEDFPAVAAPVFNSVTLPAAEFGESLRQVVRAARGDDSMKAELTGVEMSALDDGIQMAATDSYRLAVRQLRGHQVLSADQRVIVPRRALTELQRLASGAGELTMGLGERNATFSIGRTTLSTRLIEGTFPNVAHLVQTQQSNLLRVERDPLLEAISRMKIFAKDAVPVRLEMGGETLRLTAIAPDLGNVDEEIDADYQGEPITMGFNPDYLAAGIDACHGERITLASNDPGRPAVLRGEGVDDYLYLLMPVRLPQM